MREGLQDCVTLLPLPPSIIFPAAGSAGGNSTQKKPLERGDGLIHWRRGDLPSSVSELYSLCGPKSMAALGVFKDLTGWGSEVLTTAGDQRTAAGDH